MSSPISVRLDDTTRELLEKEASDRKMGLSALLREIAAEAAKEAQRRRIRAQMQKVADHIKTSSESQDFFEFWGTPTAELPE